MILYHGSYMEVKTPKILKPQKGKDFGNGFYLTPIKDHAERMAIRKVKIVGEGIPTVSKFEWSGKLDNLNYLKFDKPNIKWLNMIIECRTHSDYKHGYDIVEGKIADDNVGLTINMVIAGAMKKEDAIDKLKFQQINSQLAFCTDESLKTLKFIGSYRVKHG